MLFAVALSAAVAVTGSAAPAAPLRHLVYTFSWGNTNNTETHTSGMQQEGAGVAGGNGGSSASGMVNESAGTDDKGTITVDVLREQPDKGLVVTVSEQARDSRSASPATCVVFGNTDVVCDPNAKINYEELTLLRFLGSNFVDPNVIDAKQHWKVGEGTNGYTTTADYTISSQANGMMKIDEQRVVKDAVAGTSTIDATIDYDFGKQIPTSINETATERHESGERYSTLKTATVLTLQTDSMAAKS
jgi:hypothetical protein